MAATIYVNGKPFPSPKRELNFVVSTMVSSARNANGEVVGQKIGRDQNKLDALVWPILDAETWSAMLQEFDQFFVTVRFPDMVTNQWKTLKMYPGDRSAEPYMVDDDGFPAKYINCKVNLIDCGVID
ncbi:MAG: hypothetical protein QM683_09785 [Lacrimispora sp.]